LNEPASVANPKPAPLDTTTDPRLSLNDQFHATDRQTRDALKAEEVWWQLAGLSSSKDGRLIYVKAMPSAWGWFEMLWLPFFSNVHLHANSCRLG
jgi:hypothetical protein